MDVRGRSRLGFALESSARGFRLVDTDHRRHLDVEVCRSVALANASDRGGAFFCRQSISSLSNLLPQCFRRAFSQRSFPAHVPGNVRRSAPGVATRAAAGVCFRGHLVVECSCRRNCHVLVGAQSYGCLHH